MSDLSQDKVRAAYDKYIREKKAVLDEHNTSAMGVATRQRSELQIPRQHTVLPGDYLIKISVQYYQTESRVDDIWEANLQPHGPMTRDKNYLVPGWVLTLP